MSQNSDYEIKFNIDFTASQSQIVDSQNLDEVEEVQVTKCHGCLNEEGNQLAHYGIGGCMGEENPYY